MAALSYPQNRTVNHYSLALQLFLMLTGSLIAYGLPMFKSTTRALSVPYDPSVTAGVAKSSRGPKNRTTFYHHFHLFPQLQS